MFKILVNCLIDICKHLIGQKIHVKAWKFKSEMCKNDKNDESNVILNL